VHVKTCEQKIIHIINSLISMKCCDLPNPNQTALQTPLRLTSKKKCQWTIFHLTTVRLVMNSISIFKFYLGYVSNNVTSLLKIVEGPYIYINKNVNETSTSRIIFLDYSWWVLLVLHKTSQNIINPAATALDWKPNLKMHAYRILVRKNKCWQN
jgi:hypothetical protein